MNDLNGLRRLTGKLGCDQIKAAHKKFGRDETVAMICGNLDAENEALVRLLGAVHAAEVFYRYADDIVRRNGVGTKWET